MQKNKLLPFISFTLLLGCQRETGFELGARTEGDSTLLVKRIDISTDNGMSNTSTYDYEYNAEKKLIGIKNSTMRHGKICAISWQKMKRKSRSSFGSGIVRQESYCF